MKKIKVFSLGIVIAFSIYSCADKNSATNMNSQDNNDANQLPVKVSADTIVTGLQNPWGMAFLPDGRILITERAGTIRIVKDGKLEPQNVQNVPAVYANGQGGLLDITLHPDYNQNGWIYFSYSKPGGGGGGSTTVTRAKLNGNSFTDIQELFVVKPFVNSGVHFGSRIVFDGNGYMFISTGERGTKPNAQDLSNHNGKVMRLHDDGRVPADNPFVNTPNAQPEIWCYGNRNIQGMVYDKANNILWAHEHGPRGGDEINNIQKGKNYGWPVTTHGIDYSGSIISNDKEKEGIEPPVYTWTPSIAPCGMTLVTSDRYRGWKGNLLVGALAGQHIARVEVDGKKIKGDEKLLNGMARFRAVTEAPDGYIYAVTEGPGMFIRLRPQE
jgi:aldose sugar dehydrogenase